MAAIKQYGLLRRIVLGLELQPLAAIASFFIVYAAIWTVLEPLAAIVPAAAALITGGAKFFVLLTVSALISICRNAVPRSIFIRINNSVVEVVFGDMFLFDGLKAIPISRYFFEIEVMAASLQSQIIQFFVQSQEGSEGFTTYKRSLIAAIEGKAHQTRYRQDTQEEEKYYPLGTSAVLSLNGEKYIMFALTETELKGHIPHDNCDASKMWVALESFWQEARIHSRGQSINIPLIGSGATGIKLSHKQILELNLLAIANAIEEGGKITTAKIRIVLHPNYLSIINLNEFRSLWR